MTANHNAGRSVSCQGHGTLAETEDALHFFHRLDLYLTMDTTHLGTWALESVDLYAEWGKRVRHVHVSNFGGREHRLPTAGRLRLDDLLATLAGYDAPVSIEPHPDAVGAGKDDAAVVARLARRLEQVRGWASATAAHPHATQAVIAA